MIAVFGGTAHSALSAGICADLGVRCAAKPGQQRHCLAVLPGRGVEQRDPFHEGSRIDSARAAKTWKTSRPPGVAVHLVQGTEPGIAAARPGHGSPPCSGTSHCQAAVAALVASSDPGRRGR